MPKINLPERIKGDPELLARWRAAVHSANSNPAVIAKRAAKSKVLWSDPEYKRKTMAAMRAGKEPGKEWATTLKASVTPTVKDLHWAAGFLEGEGSFWKCRRNGGTKVSAVQVQREPIERLQSLFGGHIGYEPATKKCRERHVWTINGTRARGVMMTLYCMMSPWRKTQIERAVFLQG